MHASNHAARVLPSSALSFDPSTALTIIVGPTTASKTYMVHESFLTSRSEFFRRAMSGKWIESSTRTITLTEDSPQTFTAYLNLVYMNQIPTLTFTGDELSAMTPEEAEDGVLQEYTSLFELYVLAEKLQDSKAKDATFRAVYHFCSLLGRKKKWTLPRREVIQSVYAGTPQGSPARLFLADMWAAASTNTFDTPWDAPNDFIWDLIRALKRDFPLSTPNPARCKTLAAYLEDVNT